MQKPNNYDNTQAQGDYTPVELGGHRVYRRACIWRSF